MLSSWKNDDYRKIASAGLLGGGNIVYNGTQNDIEFFKSSSVLRICALGNDSTLHRILCNYVVTMQEFHEKLSKLSVRIFVAPTSKRKNRLATYIASKDAWYRRHIYTPLSSPTFGFPYSSNQKNGANLNMENTIQWIRMQIIEGKGLNGDDLAKFKSTIANALKLTERKRFYVSNYGVENFVDIVNGKTDTIKKAENYDRYSLENTILWWKKLATKRFNNLKADGRLRTELELWSKDSNIDIIR